MQSTVTLQTSGLYLEPNQLSVPEGALSDASNVVIQRDNVIEPRRGFGLYGTPFGSIGDRLLQLFVYQFSLLRQFNDTIQFDTGTLDNAGDELFQSFAGSFPPAQEGLRTKSVESNGNFYFTSADGIQKISAANAAGLATTEIVPAGGIKALDLTANAILQQGNITGFLTQDSTVAYRVLWGYTDANQNLILGVPSQREEVYLSLTSLLILDFNNLLQQIQNTANTLAPNNSLITNSDYVSSLVLPSSATPQDIQTNLIALSNKLDTNILIANDSGSAPLKIATVAIVNSTSSTNNVCTITFSQGNPEQYWSAGSNIFLTGFPNGETGSINNTNDNTIVTSTTIANPNTIVTTVTDNSITFLTNATGNAQTFSAANIDLVNNLIDLDNNGFKNFDPVQFTTTGTLPSPLMINTTYYLGNVTTSSFQVFNDPNLTSPVTFSGASVNFNFTNVDFPSNRIDVTNNFTNALPIEFTSTGILPSPLAVGTTYYAGNVNPTYFQIYNDVGLTSLVTLNGSSTNFTNANVNTGTNTINISNGFPAGSTLQFTTTGTLASPLAAGVTYYAGNVGPSSFQVFNDQALTSIVTLTTTGSGTSAVVNGAGTGTDSVVGSSGSAGTGINTVTYFMPVTDTSINTNEFGNIAQPAIPDTPTPDQELVNLQTYLQSIINELQTFLTVGSPDAFTSTNVDTSTSTITTTDANHLILSLPIQFETTGTLPSPLVINTTYYVGTLSGNSFQVFTDAGLMSLVTLTTQGTGSSTVLGVSPPTTSQYAQTNYLAGVTITTSANVELDITVPQGVNTNDFFQIYRSPVLSATGTTPLSELTASDELQLVYQAFVTQAQIDAGIIMVEDITPDAFLGAFLYTDESNGVGIANANETPPFALDMAKFNNVVFYANTRTKYRIASFNLLGVTKMLQDYQMNIIPELVITDGPTTNIYSFVAGVEQITQVVTVADSSDSLNGTYFLINSGNNITNYYVWYKTSGGTAIDPMVANSTGIEVFINTNDSAAIVASKTNDAINSLGVNDFSSFVSSSTITISNTAQGYTNDASAGTSGFAITTPTPGIGQKLSAITANFTTVADISNSLAGTYFTVYSAFDKILYYIWYSVSGNGNNPLVPNATGIEIMIDTNDSADTVAEKTAAQLSALSNEFTSSNPSGDTLIVAPFTYGPATNPTAGTTGFTLNSVAPGFLQVLLSSNISPSEAVDETARSLVSVINQNPAEILYAFYLSESSTIPGEMTLESRTLSTPQYYLLANNADTGSSFSPDLSPEIAISGISAGDPNNNVVTTVTPHGLQTGQQVVLSGTNSIPNADGLWTVTYLTPTTFRINTTIVTSATAGEMIAATDAVSGDNSPLVNNISYSNVLQPESVPLGNTLAIGDADKPILRIFPLRDSLFVFKQEGLWRISGTTAPWTVDLFDSSCLLTAPDSVSVAKNVVYAWTTQGILSVTESGVSNPPVSRPIDVDILPLNSKNYPNFTTATWGLGYDSDSAYIVFTVNNTTDTEATIAYRYSTLTSSWTTWDKTNTCGIVDIADDKLYLGAGDTNYVEQERKTFTRFDYADRELASVLNPGSYFGTTLLLPSVSNISIGDVVVQDQNVTVYEFNALLLKLNNDFGLQNNQISSISTGSTPTITTVGNHILSTGDFVNITNTQTTPVIDGLYQVTVTSSTQFQITVPSAVLTGGTVGLVKYSYYDSLAAVAGNQLQSDINDLAARLNLEPSLIYKYSTATITSNTASSPSIVTTSTPLALGPIGTVRQVNITGNTGSAPSINGNFEIIVTGTNTFSVPVDVTVPGTGGIMQTIDDYVTGTDVKTGSITSISATNPTVITSANHGLVSDRFVNLTGTNSQPSIDGNYIITVIDENNFSVPASVLVLGTTGTWLTVNGSFADILANYNYIIGRLNADTGTNFKNYLAVTTTTSQESIIISINDKTNQIVLSYAIDYVIGPLSIYEAIDSTFTYSPVTFKDALNLKQVSEATLMFENKAFSEATLSFASDLSPEFVPVSFQGNGNGSFGLGSGVFGANFFGGAANAAPFRTWIPRNQQRCRYIVPMFEHAVAFEKYSINGLTLTGTIGQSSRAYR